MATTHEYVGANGFNVKIKLIGIRECKLFRWLPYLSGREIRFEISIDDKPVKSIPYEWTLSCRDNQSRFWVRGKGNKKNPIKGQLQSRQSKEVINIGFLFDIGKYSFQMRWKDEIANDGEFQDIVYFYVEDNDVYISRWVQTIGSGLIGAILTALMGWIVWAITN